MLNCAALVQPFKGDKFVAAATAQLASLPRDDVWDEAGASVLDMLYDSSAEIVSVMSCYLECTVHTKIPPAVRARLRALIDPEMSSAATLAVFSSTLGVYDAAITGKKASIEPFQCCCHPFLPTAVGLLPATPLAYMGCICSFHAIIGTYPILCATESDIALYDTALTDPRWAALALACADESEDQMAVHTIAINFPQIVFHMVNPKQPGWGGNALLADPAARQRLLRLASQISLKVESMGLLDSQLFDPPGFLAPRGASLRLQGAGRGGGRQRHLDILCFLHIFTCTASSLHSAL